MRQAGAALSLALGVASAAGATLLLRIRGARRGARRKPQARFRVRLADNSDRPFIHLPLAQCSEQHQQQNEACEHAIAVPSPPPRAGGTASASAPAADAEAAGGRGRPSAGAPASLHPFLPRIKLLMERTACEVPDSAPRPPPDLSASPLHWVRTPAQLDAMVQRLSQAGRFGMDTEAHALRSYQGMLCLMQFSTGAEDWLVDALALHDVLGPALRPLLADPRVVKILHGGANDVLWCQRDFHLYFVNVFDTEKACQVLGKESRALSMLLWQYCGVRQDKVHQRADWRIRPLPGPLEQYARGDVHWLPYLADVLMLELLAAAAAGPERSLPTTLSPAVDRGVASPTGVRRTAELMTECSTTGRPVATALGHALLRSQQQCLSLYRKPLSDMAVAAAAAATAAAGGGGGGAPPALGTGTTAAAAVLKKYLSAVAGPGASSAAANTNGNSAEANSAAGMPLSPSTDLAPPHAADAVYTLCKWRDAAARRSDDSPQYVLPDSAIAALARMRPPPREPRDLVRVADAHAQAANQVLLREEPYAPRLEVSQALRQDAAALCRTLAAAAAGQMPWLGPARPKQQRLAPTCMEQTGEAPLYADGALGGADGGGQGNHASHNHHHRNVEERRQWMVSTFSAKREVYQNCRMLSQEGQLLCHCDRRKLQWYVAKGLAVQVSEDPPTMQLLFEHKNTDQLMGSDGFYTQCKANRCVVCGCEEHYLRYRVLPACYRRHLPPSLKSHRSHDVVLLCINCHHRAHKSAEQLKRRIASDYSIPLLPLLPVDGAIATAGVSVVVGGQDGWNGAPPGDAAASCSGGAAGAGGLSMPLPGGVHPAAAHRAALALRKSGANMPHERVRQLETYIKLALGRDPNAEPPGLRPGDLEAGLLIGLGKRGRNRFLKRFGGQQEEQQEEQQQGEEQEGPEQQAQARARQDASSAQGQREEDGMRQSGSEPNTAAGAGAATTSTTSTTTAAHSAVAASAGGGGGVPLPAPQVAVALGQGQGQGQGSTPWLDTGHMWHGERVVRKALETGGEDALHDLVKRFRQCFVEACQPRFLPSSWGVDHVARRDFGEYSIYARHHDGGGSGCDGQQPQDDGDGDDDHDAQAQTQ